MIRKLSRSAAFGLGTLLLASASIVSAQYAAERPADRLSRYLRELASDPTSVAALIGAGQAALDVGDGNAALGFFARADERSPRNGQIKAGLARALLIVDNPREALKMFDAARSLGVPEADIAGDRGLAYDLRGETKRAQRDYQLALTRGPNDDITKRYALSLGITGERDPALKLLDPLLYKRDQGAWRARAFILAMTGDVPGGSRIVHQVMPERMAQTMDPFLQRLASLNPAQKAAAVHLGEMPSDVRMAAATPIAQPTPAYVAPAPTASPAPPLRNARHRTVRPTPTPTPTPTPPPPPPPVQVAQFEDPAQYAPRPVPTPTPSFAVRPAQRGDLDAIMRDIRTAASIGTAVRSPAPVRVAQAPPKPTPTPTPKPSPTPKPDAKKAKAEAAADECVPVRAKGKRASTKDKCEVPADDCKPVLKKGKRVAAKDQCEVPVADCKPAPKKGRQSTVKDQCEVPVEDCKPAPKTKGKHPAAKTQCNPADAKASKQAELKKKAEPKNPARVWVQVAGGANVKSLPKEWAGVTAKAPELKSKGPFTAKNRATNRLLAGPFKSDEEAQAAVAKLRKAGIGAFRWSSDEGEAVEKIGGK